MLSRLRMSQLMQSSSAAARRLSTQLPLFARRQLGFAAHHHRRASRLTSKQVNHLLRMREIQSDEQELSAPLGSLWSSQLSANHPIEDRRINAALGRACSSGFLLGAVDGHGGAACAQAVKEWLPHYLTIALLDDSALADFLDAPPVPSKSDLERWSMVRPIPDPTDYVRKELFPFHYLMLREFARAELSERSRIEALPAPDEHQSILDAMRRAFIGLDRTIVSVSDHVVDAMQPLQSTQLEKLAIALSGAVCILVYARPGHLYVASCGDCVAALASSSGRVETLNRIHTADDAAEARRVLAEHPPSESSSVLRADRLLGQLEPLRAFGDAQYKWPLDVQRKIFRQLAMMHYIPPNYQTPPYLTAEPEVRHVALDTDDSSAFVILSTDGLVEWMSIESAALLTLEHRSGQKAVRPFAAPSPSDVLSLSGLDSTLRRRRLGLAKKPEDENVATHLIRYALGSSEAGTIDAYRLSRALSVPAEQARFTRDDLTVTVAFFNS